MCAAGQGEAAKFMDVMNNLPHTLDLDKVMYSETPQETWIVLTKMSQIKRGAGLEWLHAYLYFSVHS